MKYLFISLMCVSLCGCATKGVNTTIFLMEKNYRLHNEKNEDCEISGFQVKRDELNKEQYRLTTFYRNCSVWEVRYLKEQELKYWILPKK